MKEIILKAIKVFRKSDIFKESFGEDYKEIKTDGKSIFIKYNQNEYKSLLGQIFKGLSINNLFTTDLVKEFINDLVTEILKKGIDDVF